MGKMKARIYESPSMTVKGKTYVVRHMPDGHWRCSCPNFVFKHLSRRKGELYECKHIEYIKDFEKCPKCGGLMSPIYDNNGFNEPDPTKVELVGYKCEECEG